MGAGDLNAPKKRDKMPNFMGDNLQEATVRLGIYIGAFAVVLTILTVLFR